MFMTENNNMIYLNGKIMYDDDDNTSYKNKEESEELESNNNEELESNDNEERLISTSSYYTDNSIFDFMFYFFFRVIAIYTNIELYLKDKFNLNKKVIRVEDINLTKEKSEYSYYANNKIIATSKTLTNRKNYDFALSTHYTNVDIDYIETILCHNKIKKRNIDICPKYFISIYFSINDNDYEIKLDQDNMNFYLTNNILDYTIINFIMLDKYNVNISNVPYNLIMIDDNSNVMELKETEFIRFYKNRYTIGNYD